MLMCTSLMYSDYTPVTDPNFFFFSFFFETNLKNPEDLWTTPKL